MKSYKELAEMTETKIKKAAQKPGARANVLSDLINCWLVFMGRDRETEEEAKKEKYKKMLLYLEETLEGIDPYGKGAGRFMNLTFSYNEVRERLEIENPAADPEKENQPQVKKVLTYKDGRPAYVEKEI